MTDTTPVVQEEGRIVQNPTGAAYGSFNHAFDVFNRELFGGKLSDCLITLQRRGSYFGCYAAERFGDRHGGETKLAEIALNPAMMQGRSDREIASTLAHEMSHHAQKEYGSPSRNGYHNREFARIMERIGLMTSHTGLPGGRRTGQRMTHYIIEGGPFDLVWQKLAAEGFHFDYHDRLFDRRETAKKNKATYQCDVCQLALWGKPGITDLPTHCGRLMVEKKDD